MDIEPLGMYIYIYPIYISHIYIYPIYIYPIYIYIPYIYIYPIYIYPIYIYPIYIYIYIPYIYIYISHIYIYIYIYISHIYIYIFIHTHLFVCAYMTCTCESHISFVALASRINAGPKIPKILGLCPSKTGSTRPFFWVNLQAQKPSWLVVEPPILPKICAENHSKSSSKQGISGDSIKTSSNM